MAALESSALSRKEIRRQKLTEFLAAKNNLSLSSKTKNMVKDEAVRSERSVATVRYDKENKIPVLKRDIKMKTVQATEVKKPLGLTNTINKSSGNVIAKQNSKNTTSKDAKIPIKMQTFTKTYTIVNSKGPMNAASEKRTLSRASSAGNASSKSRSDFPAVKAVKNATTSAVSASLDRAEKGRFIHGPMIKTRTGLVPAVIQPRQSHAPRASTYKVLLKPSSCRLVSQPPVRTLGTKTFTITLKAASERSATMTVKMPNQTKNKSLPSAAKSKSVPLTDRVQSLSSCSSKSLKPYTKAKTTKINIGCAKSTVEKSGLIKPSIYKTANRDDFTVNRVTTANAHKGKTNISGDIQNKKRDPLIKHIQTHVAPKVKKRPIAPLTAPQPSRAQNLSRKPTSIKTPERRGAPPFATKPLTAAQDRIKKLKEWQASKGISYKRPPLFVKTQARHSIAAPQPFWSGVGEEDEAHSLICAVDRSLADCVKLLGEGCPTDQVKEVLTRLPEVSHKFAKYWICQARLMEKEGNLDVLPMFEKAVGLVLEPVDNLRKVVFEILKKKDEIQVLNLENCKETEPTADSTEILHNVVMTPKPGRALICAEKGNSSVVKYKITATPGGPPSQRRDSTVVNGQEVRFFTPVRRSVRIERAGLRYPVSLKDHDLCVASYNDLMAEEEEKENAQQTQSEGSAVAQNSPMYIYRANEALNDKVFVEYVGSDE